MLGTTEAVDLIVKLLFEGSVRKLGSNLADQISALPEKLVPLKELIFSRITKDDIQENNFREALEGNLLADGEYFQEVLEELTKLEHVHEISITKSPGANVNNNGTVNQDFRNMSIT